MMKNGYKAALWLGGALGALAAGTPALAQTSEGMARIDDEAIIVTARRVEENLQDVPISITVFNQEQLNNRNVAVASDLATYTPSLSINQRYGPEKSSFAIRGFNQEISTAPTVGVYFADVVGVRAQGGTVSGSTVGAGAFTDLQNVQVLKGPQGTLFGRNTTGGAVLLVPRKPTDRLEGMIEGTYGNYDQKRVQGAINVPLAETFKVRLAFDRNKRDGYLKNQADVGPDAYADLNYTYLRLSVVGDLTPDLENYTIAHYSRSNTNGYAARLAVCDRNPIDFTDPSGIKTPGNPNFSFQRVVTAAAACDQIDRQAARGDGPLDVDVGARDPFLKLEQWQIINTTTWRASDLITVKNIVSYGEIREHSSFSLNSDNFFVPELPFPLTGQLAATRGQPFDVIELDVSPGHPSAGQSTTTEELQVQGQSADGKLDFVVGGYLEFSRPIGWSQQRTGIYGNCTNPSALECTTPIGFALISQSRTKFDFDNHGIFAQASYDLTDALTLTGGVRYTFDKISGVSESTRYTYAPIPGLGQQLISLDCNDNITRPNVNIAPPVIIPGIGQVAGGDGSGDLSKCRVTQEVNSKEPTWLINLDYKPNRDILLYAKYARGYRQGGLNFTTVGLETWEPETVDAYEIGAKTSFHGGVRGYFNLAAFYNDLKGQQIFGGLVPRADSGLSGAAGIVNAGSSTLKGIEVDAAVTLFDNLNLSLGYTYLDTEIKELVIPDLTGTLYVFFEAYAKEGGPLTYSPKHRLTTTATYTLPLDEGVGRVSLGATYTYTSEQVANEESVIGVLPSSNLLNLNLNWDRVGGSDFDLALFATNVTDERYLVSVTGGLNAYGFDAKQYGAPRMYGVRLRYNFGT
ncbi:TonB-dependent receptor [Novosphingobium sp. M1R2S20]|uniref:TonB-dependent receptor n=1 Tax=Novosphingobium rhizovicinum TaxID=3228928 RepID=A0ABV3RED5_9SPHN